MKRKTVYVKTIEIKIVTSNLKVDQQTEVIIVTMPEAISRF